MPEFTLDTSGRVSCEDPRSPCICHAAKWEYLTPFAQGYVKALLSALDQARLAHYRAAPGRPVPIRPAFHWLASETLAAILRDCGEFLEWNRLAGTRAFAPDGYAARGRSWWAERNRGLDAPRFPPLTPELGDDGKVYLRSAA